MEDSLWTQLLNDSYSDEDRTKNLADDISEKYNIFVKTPQHNILFPLEKNLQSTGITINDLLDYIKKHPNMLKYEFDEDKKMKKIIVNLETMFTFFDASLKRQCEISYGITEMLKLVLDNSKFSIWQTSKGTSVEMINEPFCIEKGFTNPSLASQTDTSLHAGGNKSRRRHRRHRKPTRKTRCGRKSKSTSKTYHRKHHSRLHGYKHKKYMSRRK